LVIAAIPIAPPTDFGMNTAKRIEDGLNINYQPITR